MRPTLNRREMLRASLAAWPSWKLRPSSTALATTPSAEPNGAPPGELFHDDFSGLPAGWLSEPLGRLNTAIQEFHWIAGRALPQGAWSNGVVDQDAWLVSSEAGMSYMQQQLHHPPDHVNAVLIAGEREWRDYTVSVRVKPLALDGIVGVAFRYQTNRQYFLFGLNEGDKAQLLLQHPIAEKLRVPNWELVASAAFPYTVERYYELRVENAGPHMRAYIDDKLVVEAVNEDLIHGKAGISATVPARFRDFRVERFGECPQRHLRRHPPA